MCYVKVNIHSDMQGLNNTNHVTYFIFNRDNYQYCSTSNFKNIFRKMFTSNMQLPYQNKNNLNCTEEKLSSCGKYRRNQLDLIVAKKCTK